MLSGTSGIVKAVLSALFFPMFFQAAFVEFAWGASDPTWLMVVKRLFVLLPALAIVLGCWVTIACLLTVLIRQNRREFITALFITWWDLGKSVFAFWGGIFKFVAGLFVALMGLARLTLLGLWAVIQDMVFMPLSMMRRVGENVVRSPIPWIAVVLTIAWCIVETTIFTYVTTPLVLDTFSNITGETLSEAFVRIPLFIFLLFVVLGSYAVLSTFVDSVKGKSVSNIVGIGVIEIVVLFVEVVFLYREFVESLVPWFAQHSQNFELGIVGTLAISCFVWFGIRSLSWFLFASHGTPTIMAVIQGKGLKLSRRGEAPKTRVLEMCNEFWVKMKGEMQWVQKTGEQLTASFILPPLQVIAAGVNFCTLLIITSHLFPLPFKDIKAMQYSENLLKNLSKKSEGLQVTSNSEKKKSTKKETRRIRAERMPAEPELESVPPAPEHSFDED